VAGYDDGHEDVNRIYYTWVSDGAYTAAQAMLIEVVCRVL